MPRYDYVCPNGHVTERTFAMADMPTHVECDAPMDPEDAAGFRLSEPICGQEARRLLTPPAAIHFHGPGFYATDVKGAQQRRRRPNAGDDLRRFHDPDAARIARTL